MKTIQEMQDILNNYSEELIDAAAIEPFELYRKLAEYGYTLEPFPDSERIESNFVYGCVSNVFISARMEEGSVYYRAVSDAATVRGYLAVLLNAFNGMIINDFLQHSRQSVEAFAVETNITQVLTPTRANAFINVYELMRSHASRYKSS